jgi:hypothetical protein
LASRFLQATGGCRALGRGRGGFPAIGQPVASAWSLSGPAGDPARAAAVLVQAAGGEDLPLPFRESAGVSYSHGACSRLGRRDEAVRAATTAQSCADALGLRAVRAVADRAAAVVARTRATPITRRGGRCGQRRGRSRGRGRAAESRVLWPGTGTGGEPERAATELQAAATAFAPAAPRAAATPPSTSCGGSATAAHPADPGAERTATACCMRLLGASCRWRDLW